MYMCLSMVWVFYTYSECFEHIFSSVVFAHLEVLEWEERSRKKEIVYRVREERDFKRFSNNLLVFVRTPRDAVIAMLKIWKEEEVEWEEKNTKCKSLICFTYTTLKNAGFNHISDQIQEFHHFHRICIHVLRALPFSYNQYALRYSRQPRKNNQRHENKHHDLCIRQEEHNSKSG